jgi:hypothetical protein
VSSIQRPLHEARDDQAKNHAGSLEQKILQPPVSARNKVLGPLEPAGRDDESNAHQINTPWVGEREAKAKRQNVPPPRYRVALLLPRSNALPPGSPA